MTLSIEAAEVCPYCRFPIAERTMHVHQEGRTFCTEVSLGSVRLTKPNPIVGPLTRCPHCFETIAEGTMHTRQTGGSAAFTRSKCTVTHVMRSERRVVSNRLRSFAARMAAHFRSTLARRELRTA